MINETEVIKLYINGIGAHRIAKQFQIAKKTVYRILERNNVQIDKNRLLRKLLISDDELINLYNSGMSLTEIGNKYGVNSGTIKYHLKGLKLRKPSEALFKIPLNLRDKVIILYRDQDKSTYDISDILKKDYGLNIHSECIRHFLNNKKLIRTGQARKEHVIRKLEDGFIQKQISESCKAKWQEEEYRQKVKQGTSTLEYKEMLHKTGKKAYPIGRGKWIKSPEASKFISETTKDKWNNEEYRQKQKPHYLERTVKAAQAFVLSLQDPAKRAIWIDKLRERSVNRLKAKPFISSAQKQLYYLLSLSGITYFEEGNQTQISPFYVVDCIIPKQQNMLKDLIIEVQGEYWHSLPKAIIKDKQKKTYIKNHTDYDLLYMEELDLASFDEVSAKLSSFGLSIKGIECTVDELNIKKITEKDAQCFYTTFHYSNSIRKGATTFGAFLGETLVACISYTYPIRTQVAINLDYQLNEVMEISRLARITNIKCDNLLSWFIGRTRSMLNEKIKIIVSYSDMTHGHTGGVYKACGFTNDKEIEPDYYYISINGKYHKKTIWDRAKRMKVSELEYAEKHNLMKVYGDKKLRWIYRL